MAPPLPYHEPSPAHLLTLLSLFPALSFAEWAANRLLRAGLIGQVLIGLLYGAPVGNILPETWQEAFLALGYLGLVLIIFEGNSSFCLCCAGRLAECISFVLFYRWVNHPPGPPPAEPRTFPSRGADRCGGPNWTGVCIAARCVWEQRAGGFHCGRSAMLHITGHNVSGAFDGDDGWWS